MKAWIELVNSDWHGHLEGSPAQDRLEDPAWLAKFLAELGPWRSVARSNELKQSLKRLRGLLKRVAESCLANKRASDDDLAALNKYLSAAAVRPKLSRDGRAVTWEWIPAGDSSEASLFVIAASAADFLTRGDVSRLRRCANPACAWLFVDATRSRTSRWCGGTCRSLIKVRALRARRNARSRRKSASGRQRTSPRR
jgi:predicted RNA-binding Zn ribbon-like protein